MEIGHINTAKKTTSLYPLYDNDVFFTSPKTDLN